MKNNRDLEFAPGQRWVSETEPELGMGVLANLDQRTLTFFFPVANCTRQYSRSGPPIRRIRFKPGDRIKRLSGQELLVERVEEAGGLYTYFQGKHSVCETELSASIDLDLPFDRLMSGLGGRPGLFDLRCRIREALAACQASQARGFLGGQVDLIPHQFYIAGEVCQRYFPRVLLSDETGLGKTIEAGLVLHRLLVTGQIRRVLVIVPRSLVHQWFIELFRKFSLRFRLFDEEYCREALASEPDMNPFSLDQCGICAQDFILANPLIGELLLDAGFDMVVMDEAHHMTDDPDFYGFMAALGQETRGLMLLTATPEQMGMETHFAQLHLLDPDRYPDFQGFLQEASGYEDAAIKARQLLAQGRSADHLLDAFGPGRVVFRNRRRSIQGFPPRKTELIALDGTPEQIRLASREAHKRAPDLSQDPRVIHLAELCRTVKPEKILVICRSKELVAAVVQGLAAHITVDAARFDETMDLLQRDRQAAWFADPDGARILVCSEIGSEGRNFQFVRRLFLFDLPMNPELLEQRIGRVDRIGQKQEIILHVPYVRDSPQEILALWYDQGLGLFRENVNGLYAVFTQFEDRLTALMDQVARTQRTDQEALTGLIADTAAHTRKIQQSLDQGRHILLELNSFKPEPARMLIETIRKTEQADALFALMETLLDFYGVDMEQIREARGNAVVRLKQDRDVDEGFPALPGRGGFATFDRHTAIARDDLEFFTWDHPFVHQALEYFLTQGEGASAVAVLEGADRPGLVLETLFLLELPDAESCPGAAKFLPSAPIRLFLDHGGKPLKIEDLGPEFPAALSPDHPGWFLDLPELSAELLPSLLEKSLALAEDRARQLRQQGLAALDSTLGDEVDRLKALSRVNPGVTEREIDGARAEQTALRTVIQGARLRLDAVRLIRLSPPA